MWHNFSRTQTKRNQNLHYFVFQPKFIFHNFSRIQTKRNQNLPYFVFQPKLNFQHSFTKFTAGMKESSYEHKPQVLKQKCQINFENIN